MKRREFLVGTVVAGAGTTSLAFTGTAAAATCEVDLYNPLKATMRLTYPAKPGETPVPLHLEWPVGHARRYLT